MSDMLLDLLRARVGETIRKVSPRKGGEYHSPCPSCGGNDRFICFPEQPGGDVAQRHGLTGTWSCPRHCQTGGDIISFLTTFEGLSFGDACKQLGIDSSQEFRRYRPLRQPGRQPGGSNGFTPRAYAAPADQWVAQATKLATKAHARLMETPNVLAWLARRGLPVEAMLAYGLGYIEGEGGDGTCIFRSRESFGLPTILKENGKLKKLRIPRGVTIPAWNQDGSCLRIRIRKRNADIDKNNPKDSKYILVPQPDAPYSAPLMLSPVGVPPELATWVVVEAELDAMAVHHACGGRVGALSVLTVAGRPDTTAHAALSRAARILVALDFDSPAEAGETVQAEGEDKKPMPAAQAWPWWASTYEQARLWPVPEGKDPGDAFALGVDLRAWIQAGAPDWTFTPPAALPASDVESCGISVAQSGDFDQSPAEIGDLGASIRGSAAAGDGEGYLPTDTSFSETPREIPADVLDLARMWQGLPVRIRWLPDADGRHRAMMPEHDPVYGHDRQRVDDFLRRIWSSSQIWEWLAANENDVVTAENCLPQGARI